jgi:hypothetical protein
MPQTMQSAVPSLMQNWGSGKPPGGPGTCPVLRNGAFYNATCKAKQNFACEEKKTSPGETTTKHA